MKLIRSNYKDIIEKEKLIIEDNEKQRHLFLKKKLHEEFQELLDSGYKDVQEYGDVLQVMIDLGHFYGISYRDIREARTEKYNKFGDFSEGVYLK